FERGWVAVFCRELGQSGRLGGWWGWPARPLGCSGFPPHPFYSTSPPPTPAAPYGSLLLLAWVLALFYLYGTVHHAKQAWAIFVLPVVIGLVGLSFVFLVTAGNSPPPDVPAWLAGERFWGAGHGALSLPTPVRGRAR